MKTSRQQILDYINQQRAVSIPQLSQALHSTQANIRHHLNILLEQGLIQVVGMTQPDGRGRPAQLFGPPPERRGSNLPMLAQVLLSQSPPEQAAALGRQMAEQLLPQPAAPSAHPAQRLLSAVEALNRAHYEARWEPRPHAPQLILQHCPYWQVLGAAPWLCQMDAALLEKLTGAAVEQTARLVDDGQQGKRCVFQVKK